MHLYRKKCGAVIAKNFSLGIFSLFRACFWEKINFPLWIDCCNIFGNFIVSLISDSHPQLVNDDTDHIDMIKVMKNFHHMTEPFVREHWNQYKKFDTDGNGSLDLSEVEIELFSFTDDENDISLFSVTYFFVKGLDC